MEIVPHLLEKLRNLVNFETEHQIRMRSFNCNTKYVLISILGVCFLVSFYCFLFHPKGESQRGSLSLNRDQVVNWNAVVNRKPNEDQAPAGSKVPSTLKSHKFLMKPEMKGATVLTRTETAWSRDDASCDGDKSFVKVDFHSPAGLTPLYVHPAKSDIDVSGTLIKGKVWESEYVNMIYNLLKREPDLQFLDLGANVGVYGITAAKLGRNVILVDPLVTDIQKLCNSVRDGYFSDVYVIRNALSSERHRISFTNQFSANVGATHIRDATATDKDTAYAVPLDDMLDVFNFTKVAIKMDVEAHEHRVLKGAEQFFSKVDVRYMLMEWREDKYTVETGKSIVDFLARHNIKPFHPSSGEALNPAAYKKWPGDVMWKKTK